VVSGIIFLNYRQNTSLSTLVCLDKARNVDVTQISTELQNGSTPLPIIQIQYQITHAMFGKSAEVSVEVIMRSFLEHV
jgi:hypothetical protein